MKKIFFADGGRKEDIERLRMEEYPKAAGFVVDPTTLRWKPSDDESYVMVAEHDHRLIATMRGEVIDDRLVLEKKLECPWDFPLELEGPVLLLSRAATSSEFRSSGLNLALRYWFLRLASAHGIRFVIGTFVSGSPRERSLAEMGYRLFENPLGWRESTYRSLRPVKVAVLDLEAHGAQALRYALDHSSELIRDYSFEGDFPDLRFVRSL